MKRIIYVLGVLLFLSVSLNVIYELKTHKFEKKIHKMVCRNDNAPSENVLATFNNNPLRAYDGVYEHGSDSTISIVFLGNSITRHSVWEQKGDQRARGMAATSLEQDFVHLLIELMANSYNVNVKYSIAGIANLERGYTTFDFNIDSCFQLLGTIEPDILILQMGENVAWINEEENADKFKKLYSKIFEYYPNSHKYVSLPFWLRSDENYLITEVATNYGAIVVDLSHLGADADKNFASSQKHYEHAGIGMHPGDEGMLNIANCFFSAIRATIQ